MTVITRFAPSPTGSLHIGGVRTALFSWAFAKKNKGKFFLRIEDTDLERSTPEAIDVIKDGMSWLNLDYDGDIIYQTQRQDQYKKFINYLLDNGMAYYCYASKEELDNLRAIQVEKGLKPKYDGRWRPEVGKDLPSAPKDRNPVIRFKNPSTGKVTWKDLVKSHIIFDNEELDDFIISRSDGTPTYNFCVVIDDWQMKVTHVIRGDDHINNTPRQINLLNALEAPIPNYAHLSMIHGADGQKLSKRHGAISVTSYRDEGYLPEAINNYLARLGWSHGDDEIFTMSQFCDWFDFEHITSSPAQFDIEKLNWLNSHYIKHSDTAKLVNILKKNPNLAKVTPEQKPMLIGAIELYKHRENNLNDFVKNIDYFFNKPFSNDELMKKYFNEDSGRLIKIFTDNITEIVWSDEGLNQYLKEFVKNNEIKFPQIAMPLRIILTGTDHTPSVGSIIFLLGLDEFKSRVKKYL